MIRKVKSIRKLLVILMGAIGLVWTRQGSATNMAISTNTAPAAVMGPCFDDCEGDYEDAMDNAYWDYQTDIWNIGVSYQACYDDAEGRHNLDYTDCDNLYPDPGPDLTECLNQADDRYDETTTNCDLYQYYATEDAARWYNEAWEDASDDFWRCLAYCTGS